MDQDETSGDVILLVVIENQWCGDIQGHGTDVVIFEHRIWLQREVLAFKGRMNRRNQRRR